MTGLDGNVCHKTVLSAEAYEETPESRTSPRGLAESSVISLTIDSASYVGLLKVTAAGKTFYVPRAVLEAALALPEPA